MNAEQHFLSSHCNHNLLTQEEEYYLISRAQDGDKNAEDLLITHNQKLIVKIAKGYFHNTTGTIELLDLVQSGNIGLLRAIRMFDISEGTRLSTYATYWIRNFIRRQIVEHSLPIRPSYRIGDMMFSIGQSKTNMQQKLEREPTTRELAEYIDINSPLSGIQKYDIERLNGLSRCVSIDDTVNNVEGNESSLQLDEIIDDGFNVEYEFERIETLETLKVALKRLDPRLAKVITLRFGLEGNGEMTYEEVGKTMNFSKARAQQLGEVALATLRKMSQLKYYKEKRC